MQKGGTEEAVLGAIKLTEMCASRMACLPSFHTPTELPLHGNCKAVGWGLGWLPFSKTISLCHQMLPGAHPKLSRSTASYAYVPCSFSILLDTVKLSCKSKIKGLSAGHKALAVDVFSVVCNSNTERGLKKGGWGGADLLALNLFINLLKVFYHFPTFIYKSHWATFTNYKISFYVQGPANGTAKSREQED